MRPTKRQGPIGALVSLWETIARSHCRGFLLGGVIGCLGSPVVLALAGDIGFRVGIWTPPSHELFDPFFYALFWGMVVGAPFGALLGATLGSAIDFSRERDRVSLGALVCMTAIESVALFVLALSLLN